MPPFRNPAGAFVLTTAESTPRPLRADAHRNRERLLAAAETAFAEHGTDSSLEEVARRAGVGIGTLYRHFPTREALVEATLRRHVEALLAGAQELLPAPDPAEALATWLRFLVAKVGIHRGMPASVLRAMKDPECDLGRLCQRMLEAGTQLLVRAQEVGAVRPDTNMEQLGAILSAVAMASDGAHDHDLADKLISLLMDGIRSRPG